MRTLGQKDSMYDNILKYYLLIALKWFIDNDIWQI